MGKLKEIRLQKGYTQAYVANQLGVSKSTYCMLEQGKIKLSVSRANQLSEIFNISPLIFFNKKVC